MSFLRRPFGDLFLVVRAELGPGARLEQILEIVSAVQEMARIAERFGVVARPPQRRRFPGELVDQDDQEEFSSIGVYRVRYENPLELVLVALASGGALETLRRLLLVARDWRLEQERRRIENLRLAERLRIEHALASALEAELHNVRRDQHKVGATPELLAELLSDLDMAALVPLLRALPLEVHTTSKPED
jgi:hypothetical protein